jgi:hypothetical protein
MKSLDFPVKHCLLTVGPLPTRSTLLRFSRQALFIDRSTYRNPTQVLRPPGPRSSGPTQSTLRLHSLPVRTTEHSRALLPLPRTRCRRLIAPRLLRGRPPLPARLPIGRSSPTPPHLPVRPASLRLATVSTCLPHRHRPVPTVAIAHSSLPPTLASSQVCMF